MITAEFALHDQTVVSFSVTGHALFSEAPRDILCAAVSAMTQLVLNTLQEVIGAVLDLVIDEEQPLISAAVCQVPAGKEASANDVLQGFLLQMTDLQKRYPNHLTIRTNNTQKGY